MTYQPTIPETILRKRKQLLVHRILYYCYNKSIIDDYTYDQWNKQLNEFEEQYPEIAAKVQYHSISPNRTVGSDNLYDYPVECIRTAEWLRDYKEG